MASACQLCVGRWTSRFDSISMLQSFADSGRAKRSNQPILNFAFVGSLLPVVRAIVISNT